MTKPETKSVAQIMTSRQDKILTTWLGNIKTLAGTRTMELMTEEQLRLQTTELLKTLITAFESEIYNNIEIPAFRESVAIYCRISVQPGQSMGLLRLRRPFMSCR